jgi:PEP-CTERM motif
MRGKHICTLIACLCLASAAITAQAAQKQRAFTPENSGFNIMPIAPADDNGAALDPTVLPNNPGNAAAVPEPATWGMLILGSGLLAGIRRFRRKHL